MTMNTRLARRIFAAGWVFALLTICLVLVAMAARDSKACSFKCWGHPGCAAPFGGAGYCPPSEELGGTWYWLRSPEEEKRVIMSLYNRYCIRCHGIDGRGVWDIPDVPDFTNDVWQGSRNDGQLARAILEGRGAVMPPWRGTLTLEEAWAMARYLRTFTPGTETARPDYTQPEKSPAEPKRPEGPGSPK